MAYPSSGTGHQAEVDHVVAALGFFDGPDGAAIIDQSGRVVVTNANWTAMSHAMPGTLVPDPPAELLAELPGEASDRLPVGETPDEELRDDANLLDHYERLGIHDPLFSGLAAGLSGVLLGQRPAYTRDLEVLDAGAPRWIHVRVSPIGNPASAGSASAGTASAGTASAFTTGALVLLTDVTERKQIEAHLVHEAMHDPLTGLANRALFADRLNHALQRAARNETPDVAVLMIDLDHFKQVNDQLGHQEADQVLIAIAKRLESSSRPGDTVARIGGDEFAVICEGVTDTRLGLRIAQRLLGICSQPVMLAHGELDISMSIGMAMSSAEAMLGTLLMAQADTALYRSKVAGRNRVEVFDEALRAEVNERMTLERDLRLGFEKGEFELLYQPMIDLKTGEVAGAEALLRWRRGGADGELAMPSAFIPTAEECGLIIPLGLWVLERACEQAMRWQAPQMKVSVNVSGRQMQDPDLVANVVEILDRTGLAPERLCLEITESVLIADGVKAVQRLAQLRRLGVKIALDDFGTGFSSLSYLHRFPVDTVKIDRSFVEGLGTDLQATAIVTAIISMTSALGISAVAEGVETLGQLDAVRQLGSTEAQGFYFAQPLDEAGLLRYTTTAA